MKQIQNASSITSGTTGQSKMETEKSSYFPIIKLYKLQDISD